MQTEIEVKFLHVDHDDVREKLKAAGAVLEKPMRLMRRVVVDYADRRLQSDGNAWIRIRDEGDKVTLTYKRAEEGKFGGAEEIEVTVSSYEKTIALFQAIGMIIHTDQETMRETWTVDGVEVVLDVWPWLDPYIEIEGPSEKDVKEVAARIGFDWDKAVFGTVTSAYREQYPNIEKDGDISAISSIKFSDERPDWFLNGEPK